jgi:hypothetical protein
LFRQLNYQDGVLRCKNFYTWFRKLEVLVYKLVHFDSTMVDVMMFQFMFNISYHF